jgi:hypothetical protein
MTNVLVKASVKVLEFSYRPGRQRLQAQLLVLNRATFTAYSENLVMHQFK